MRTCKSSQKPEEWERQLPVPDRQLRECDDGLLVVREQGVKTSRCKYYAETTLTFDLEGLPGIQLYTEALSGCTSRYVFPTNTRD